MVYKLNDYNGDLTQLMMIEHKDSHLRTYLKYVDLRPILVGSPFTNHSTVVKPNPLDGIKEEVNEYPKSVSIQFICHLFKDFHVSSFFRGPGGRLSI